VFLLSLVIIFIQLFVAVTGTSRILKQLFSNMSEDDSDLGIVNKMAVSVLIKQGQSLDTIVGCLKVSFSKLVTFHLLTYASITGCLLRNYKF